jgi:hypothetical protein
MANNYQHYVPILKGRLGEFTALSHMADVADVGERFTPLLEMVPGQLEFDDDGEPEPLSVTNDIRRFVDRANSKWEGPLILDAELIPGGEHTEAPILQAMGMFRGRAQPIRPVVRPSDEPRLIHAIGDALRDLGSDRACIRLAGEDLDDTEDPLPTAIDNVLEGLGIAPSQIDLILDLGAVGDEQSAGFAARIARLVLGELPYEPEWNTLAVGAGSFPTDLSDVQPNVLSPVPRHDAEIWRSVRRRVTGRIPSFADYAIAHPVMPIGAGFAPAPQLRYTAAQEWLVMKGRKSDRRGSRQFFDICRVVEERPEFTAGLSWGDRTISEAARFNDQEEGGKTGNAMTWRAIGTSHHVALVISRLANLDEP